MKHFLFALFLVFMLAGVFAEEYHSGSQDVGNGYYFSSVSPATADCVSGLACEQFIDLNNLTFFEHKDLGLGFVFGVPLVSFRLLRFDEPVIGSVLESFVCPGDLTRENNIFADSPNKNLAVCSINEDTNKGDFVFRVLWQRPFKSLKGQKEVEVLGDEVVSGGDWVDVPFESAAVGNTFIFYTKGNDFIKEKKSKKFKIIYSVKPQVEVGKFDFLAYRGKPKCVLDGSCDLNLDVDPWFNSSWGYVRPITIVANSDLNLHEQVAVNFNSATLVSAGKLNSNCNDLRVVYGGSSVLDFNVTGCNSADTNVYFLVQASISSGTTNSTDYNLYYGNAVAAKLNSVGVNVVCQAFDANGNCLRINDSFDQNSFKSGEWVLGGSLGATGHVDVNGSALVISGTFAGGRHNGLYNVKRIGWEYGLEEIFNVCVLNGEHGNQALEDKNAATGVAFDNTRINFYTSTVPFGGYNEVACPSSDKWFVRIANRDVNFFVNGTLKAEGTASIDDGDAIWHLYDDMNVALDSAGVGGTIKYFDYSLRTFPAVAPTVSLGAEKSGSSGRLLTVDGYSDTQSRWFGSQRDGNITFIVDFNSVSTFLVDFNVGTVKSVGSGTMVFGDVNNLQSRFTLAPVGSPPYGDVNLVFDLNSSLVADNNYFFLFNLKNDYNFALSSVFSFGFDNTVPVFLQEVVSSDSTDSSPDFNIQFTEANFKGCWYDTYTNSSLASANNFIDADKNPNGWCNIQNTAILGTCDTRFLIVKGTDVADNNSVAKITSNFRFDPLGTCSGGGKVGGSGGGGGSGITGGSVGKVIDFVVVGASDDFKFATNLLTGVNNQLFNLVIENTGKSDIGDLNVVVGEPLNGFLQPVDFNGFIRVGERKAFRYFVSREFVKKDMNNVVSSFTLRAGGVTKSYTGVFGVVSSPLSSVFSFLGSSVYIFTVDFVLLGLSVWFLIVFSRFLNFGLYPQLFFGLFVIIFAIGLLFTGVLI